MNISSRTIFLNLERRQGVFDIVTNLTRYRVSVATHEINLYGPGLEDITYSDEEVPSTLDPERRAISAVLLFEGEE
jgi:hypothetical protein